MSYPYQPPDFLGAIARGLQVRSMIENIKAQREARAQQAELHRLAIEQHQQQNALSNFKTTMMLQDIGALPVLPGATGQMQAGLAGRGTVQAPGGQQYSLPTREQKYARAQEEAQQAGTLKGIEQKATTAVNDPNIEMDFGDAGKFPIPRSQVVNALKVKQDLQGDKYQSHTFQTDDEGNTTFVGIPKGGGNPVSIPLGTIGKTKPPKTQSESSLNAAAKLRAKNRVKQEYSGSHISQMTDDYAKGLYQTYAQEDGIDWKVERAAAGDASALDEVDMTQAEAARKINAARSRAQSEARRIVQNDLEKLEAQYTDEELAKGSQPQVASKGAGIATAAMRQWTIKQSDVPKAAKLKGMSIEEFLKAAQENGGTIVP